MQNLKFPTSSITCDNFINGEFRRSERYQEISSPYNGLKIGTVALSDRAAINAAVDAAVAAFPAWRQTSPKERGQLLFRFRQVVLDHLEELSHLAAIEAGKTLGEARAGIMKGIEVTEFATSLSNLDSGGMLEVSRGVTCESRREPLGVVAGIAPFNFPAMVPMWMYPIALAIGNCFILKPSEKVPLTSRRMVELAHLAGFPKGVFSTINGDRSAAMALVEHPQVRAVGFVGSTAAAKAVYQGATSLGKRALCLGGAKNQSIVVPDCDPKGTSQGILDSFTGCAGQRCMALSLLIAVGEVDSVIEKLVEKAAMTQLGRDIGAIIDQPAKDRIIRAINRAEEQGAKIILDGRKTAAPKGFENGHWIGATIIDRAEPTMECAQQEIFGPVLTIIRCKTLQEAMEIERANPYGNATSVFTTSGAVARFVCEQSTSGMVGVNIGVPVPREPFSFGGTKDSKFGNGDMTGTSAVGFWSDLKKVTTKWSHQNGGNWMS